MTSAESTRTRRELARVIFSRLVGMIVIVAVLLVVVLLAAYLSPWRYRSKSLLMASPGASATEDRATLRERLSLFVVTQRELLLSDYVIASALMKLDGAPAPAGAMAVDKKARWYSPKQVSGFIDENYKRVRQVRAGIRVETPGGADVNFTQIYSVTVEWAEDRGMTDWPSADSREAASKGAQAFAGHLLASYQYRRQYLDIEQTRQVADFRRDTATVAAEKALGEANAKLEAYITDKLKGDLLLVENMLSGIGETGNQSLRTTFQAEINNVDARLAELQALGEQVDKELRKPATEQVVVPTEILKANPSMIKLTDAIANLRLTLNNLRPRFTDKYKTVQDAELELKADISDLQKALKRQRTIVDQEKAGLTSRRKALVDIVAVDEKRLDDLATKTSEYKRLKRTVDGFQGIYDTRLQEAALATRDAARAKTPMEVSVIDDPTRPDAASPHRPLLWLNGLVGLLAGLTLALAYAFVADHFDHSVKGLDDVDRHVGVPVLASIPKMRGKIIHTR